MVGGEKRRNIIKTVQNPLSENKPRKTESVTDQGPNHLEKKNQLDINWKQKEVPD